MTVERILTILRKSYQSTFFNRRRDQFKVLISTVLSQRTRDESTDQASSQLFAVYKDARQLAKAPTRSIEKLIKPSGFYHVKAKRIKKISKELIARYNGKVPADIKELLSLEGVGRKTANCVLVYGFRKPAIPVDTHVHRISNRIGWVRTRSPEQTETALTKLLPKKFWIELNELLVKHGQSICLPRTPRCRACPINRYCRYGRRLLK